MLFSTEPSSNLRPFVKICILIHVYMCVSVCHICVVPTEARRRCQTLMELELQVIVAYLKRVLGEKNVPCKSMELTLQAPTLFLMNLSAHLALISSRA